MNRDVSFFERNVDVFLANLESFKAYAVFRPINYYGIDKKSLRVAESASDNQIEKPVVQIIENALDDEESDEAVLSDEEIIATDSDASSNIVDSNFESISTGEQVIEVVDNGNNIITNNNITGSDNNSSLNNNPSITLDDNKYNFIFLIFSIVCFIIVFIELFFIIRNKYRKNNK